MEGKVDEDGHLCTTIELLYLLSIWMEPGKAKYQIYIDLVLASVLRPGKFSTCSTEVGCNVPVMVQCLEALLSLKLLRKICFSVIDTKRS